jgi:hypothetical protein
MKKIVLFALLVAVAASAHAVGVKANQDYECNYHNYSGPAVGGMDGYSRFSFDTNVFTLQRGIEYFWAHSSRFGDYQENQKVTFSNPVQIRESGMIVGTRWQFTVNPSGPQCTAEVYDGGDTLYFFNCSDGHSRYCSPK